MLNRQITLIEMIAECEEEQQKNKHTVNEQDKKDELG